MKLLYDGQIFSAQKAGGINRYFAEIITRLPPTWEPTLVADSELGAHIPNHPNLLIRRVPFFRPRRLNQRLRSFHFARSLRRAAVLHPTYYSLPYGVGLSRVRCPVVVTVYDMIYAHYPDLMEDSDAFLRTQREAVLRADHIICISQHTERELLDRIPQATGKTSVIYLASSFSHAKASHIHQPTGESSFLYVGGRAAYKNFLLLIRAFAAAAQSCRNIRLRIVGAPLAEHERWQLHYLGIAHMIDLHVFPDEESLQVLYRTSVALLYPSRNEGFGIPPLEAMSCGTIAVTANTTSLPEVVGTGGIMLDPADEAQWTDCILQLAKGRVDRAALTDRGFERAASFSWDKTAAQHVKVYEGVYA